MRADESFAAEPDPASRGTGPSGKAHRCGTQTTTAGRFYPGHPGYQVVCDTCGPVGAAHESARDAQAVANRHSEIGGFERSSATERRLEEVTEEATETLEEAIGNTSEFSMEDALEFWQTIAAHCRMAIEATEADIRRQAERRP